ncbi:protein containing ABC transporter-like domain protein [gut metagenome]|uniref:Protein containing ABC transporter-like domain protein n=1 Tax=gut metagenome TaxID=749906 RepID=J9FT33_9ZZZZ
MYPFQLSGGMARRVLISTAVMHNPELIVADEPNSRPKCGNGYGNN